MTNKKVSNAVALPVALLLVVLNVGTLLAAYVDSKNPNCKLSDHAPTVNTSEVPFVLSEDRRTMVQVSGYIEFIDEQTFAPIEVKQVNVTEFYERSDKEFIVNLQTDCGVIALIFGNTLGNSGVRLYDLNYYEGTLTTRHPITEAPGYGPQNYHLEYNAPYTRDIYSNRGYKVAYLHLDSLHLESRGNPDLLKQHKFSRDAIDMVAILEEKRRKELAALEERRKMFNGKDGAC